MKLITCDIYRDGGSLEGLWLTDENKEWAATLRIVRREVKGAERTYQLFQAPLNAIGQNPQIAKGSPEHIAIMDHILSWVGSTIFRWQCSKKNRKTTTGCMTCWRS